MKLLLIAAIGAASLFIAFPSLAKDKRAKLTSQDVEAVVSGVRRELKDPLSANFTGIVTATDGDGVVSACGFVNAKNSFGGFAGNVPFTGVLATNTSGKRVFAVIGIGDGGTGSQAILIMCSRQGTPL